MMMMNEMRVTKTHSNVSVCISRLRAQQHINNMANYEHWVLDILNNMANYEHWVLDILNEKNDSIDKNITSLSLVLALKTG